MKTMKRNDSEDILDAKHKHVCVACKLSFQYNCLLKYHIRQYHFKCVGLAPYADTQNVNEVWIEKVENTDTLVKIQKVSSNELLIQKVKDDTTQPTKMQREVIDVRKQCSGDVTVQCRVCQKSFGRRKLGKHFAANHAHLVRKRCDACGTPFKRVYNCACHICPASSVK